MTLLPRQAFLYIPDIDPGRGTSEAPGDKGDEDNRNTITVTTKSKHSLSVVGYMGKPVTNTLILSQGRGRCCGRSLQFGWGMWGGKDHWPSGAVHLGGLSPNPCSLPHTSQAHPWARPSKSQDCDAMRTRGDGLGHLLGWGLVLMGPRDTDWACCGRSGKTVGPEGWAGFTRKSRRSVEGGGLFLVGGPCWGMEQSHGEDKWCSGGGEEASGHDEAGLSAEPAGLSRLTACGIFLDQGSNLSPLCWQVDSLDHQGSSGALFFKAKHWCRDCQSFCWACHPDRWQRKCGQYEVEKANVICV